MAAPRIGELLVHDGLITAEARERALRSQAVHGGRLGTNLIEQFALGLDDLAEGLARQHDMPAALDRHFSSADPAIAPELRVLYHLERVYGIERANRFKRGPRRPQEPEPGRERRGYVRTF